MLLTSDISLSTGKGRHTSTRREMVLMNGSGVLIDTPGVREFGLVIDNPDSLAEVLESLTMLNCVALKIANISTSPDVLF